jgi:hypothetical protein
MPYNICKMQAPECDAEAVGHGDAPEWTPGGGWEHRALCGRASGRGGGQRAPGGGHERHQGARAREEGVGGGGQWWAQLAYGGHAGGGEDAAGEVCAVPTILPSMSGDEMLEVTNILWNLPSCVPSL